MPQACSRGVTPQRSTLQLRGPIPYLNENWRIAYMSGAISMLAQIGILLVVIVTTTTGLADRVGRHDDVLRSPPCWCI
jgi:hypothetical protein